MRQSVWERSLRENGYTGIYMAESFGCSLETTTTFLTGYTSIQNCSTSGSNYCLLICTQVFQEADNVVWYSHFLKNFPVCHDHTVKGFSIVSESKIDDFLESLCFSMIQWMLAIWSLAPLPFLIQAYTCGSSWFMYYWSLAWRILSISLQ